MKTETIMMADISILIRINHYYIIMYEPEDLWLSGWVNRGLQLGLVQLPTPWALFLKPALNNHLKITSRLQLQ